MAELRFGVADEGETHDALAEKIADLGDRVEVLRPLAIDPMEARRRRALVKRRTLRD